MIHGQASSYQKVLGKAKNAYYRYGFTATPLTSELRDQDNNRFRNNVVLKEWFGPVIFSISTREMISLGFLAEPFVKIVQNRFEPDEVLEYAQEVDRQIVRNRERNAIISDIAARGYSSGNNRLFSSPESIMGT